MKKDEYRVLGALIVLFTLVALIVLAVCWMWVATDVPVVDHQEAPQVHHDFDHPIKNLAPVRGGAR